MGQQVSVETFSSSVDKEGNRYWASFDPYPFKAGNRKLAYMGLLNGDGPLVGKKCVVKVTRKGRASKDEWLHEQERAKVAQEMASFYNEAVSEHEYRVMFNRPIMAEIDQLSDCLCLSDIMGKPKKKMEEMEFVLIEHYIRGEFQDFEFGWADPVDLEVTEAFSHYSWCRSEGDMLISNLQGVKTTVDYQLTGPMIHSTDVQYGSRDQGLEGIKAFFRLHKCNRICDKWPRLGDGQDLRGWGRPADVNKRLYPSAPPLAMHAPPPYQSNLPIMPYAPPPFGYAVNWHNQFSSRGIDNPVYPAHQFQAMPYMMYMQQMSYAFAPPPPYCACRATRCGCAHDRNYSHVADTARDGDMAPLLPATSEEALVVPDQDYTTYL